MHTVLKILNTVNGADLLLEKYLQKLVDIKKPKVVMQGIAYGGDVEMAARILPHGLIFGYDTFENGHPKHLAKNVDDFEASCMDSWYQSLGMSKLDYVYQKKVLEELEVNNVTLIKGEVNKDSCDFIKKIDLAWLDMDLLVSMRNGFDSVKDKIKSGGYLITHDVDPKGHIAGLHELFYDELIDDTWTLVESVPNSFFTVWTKK